LPSVNRHNSSAEFGVRLPVMLTGVDVSCTPGASTVSIRVEAVDDDLPELIKLQERKQVKP